MKPVRNILCGLLTAVMCLSLCACGSEQAAPSPTAAPTPSPTPAPPPAARSADADTPDKEETVYVKADPSGNVDQITVETVLNYIGAGESVLDATRLTDIKNTEGDEEFTLGSDGTLAWEDHGEKIRYEGKSGGDLPVTVSLTYWLDGQKIAPADLAGKSGHVRIRFDYVNHTAETVTVTHARLEDNEDADEPGTPETEDVTVPIPFLAVSLAMLPEDVFTNVTVENGRLMSLGESAVVMGYALPGLADALSLGDLELTEDVDLPSYVEIEADAEDFALDFTATIVMNGLLKELEEEDLDDLEKLSLGMDELSEASGKLVDGTRELSDGAEEFADYLAEYVSGAAQLSSGAGALSGALAAVSSQLGPVRSGAQSAGELLGELRSAVDGLDIPVMTDTAAALEAVIAALDGFQAQLAALPGYADSVNAAVSAADSALANADPAALYAILDSADLTDEQRAALQNALAGQIGTLQNAIDSARSHLGTVPAALESPELASYADTLSHAAAALRAKAAEALAKADELPSSPAEALDELGALVSGVTALCDGIDQLTAGASTLASGAGALAAAGSALNEAAEALADGTEELADGMEKFDGDGISEMTDLADDGLVTVVTQLRALRLTDAAYENFGGIAAGRTGSVRFIIETDSIE